MWIFKDAYRYQIFLMAAVYLVPLLVMSVAYLRIGLTLWTGPMPAEQSLYEAGQPRFLIITLKLAFHGADTDTETD